MRSKRFLYPLYYSIFFLKPCLKVGGAAYTQARLLHKCLWYSIVTIVCERWYIFVNVQISSFLRNCGAASVREMKNNNLVLSNELIKFELPLWKV